jgi:ABC-type branched-subunit amino acid transport system substrate-binding protein
MRQRRGWIGALLVLAVITAACGDDDGGEEAQSSDTTEEQSGAEEPTGEPIKLGVITAVEGGTLSRPWVRETAEIAAAAVNAEGGIMDRPVEIVFCDHRNTPQDAAVCAQRLLVEEEVLMLVGGDGVQEGSIVPTLEAANTIAFAAGGAHADALQSDREYMLQPILLNNWAIPQALPDDISSVAYASADTAIAREGRERTKAFFGDDVEFTDLNVPFTATDFQPFCLQIQQGGAEAVITNFNSQQIPTMIQTCNQIGLTDLTWVVTTTVVIPEIVETLTDLDQQNVTITSYSQEAYDGLNADIEEYGDEVGEVSNTFSDDAISAWLGVRLLAQIIPEVGAVDAVQIKEYLDQQTALDTMGATPPLDLTATPVPQLPRLKNTSPWPASYEDGRVVQTGDEPLVVELG